MSLVLVEERNDLLERAVALLKDDEPIEAAWLHGSIGRGTHDRWSDLDLWIVVADDSMADVASERLAFVSRLGTPLLTVEAPQNAPKGGAYLLAMYAGTNGPHILDCSWQPLSSARRSHDTRLLFDHVGVPEAEAATDQQGNDALERAQTQTAFFWMMVTVVAKNIARGRLWEVVSQLSFVWAVLAQIEWLVEVRADAPTYKDTPPFDLPVEGADQVAALRGLVFQMEGLMARVPSLGQMVGDDAVPNINRYLDAVEDAMNRKG